MVGEDHDSSKVIVSSWYMEEYLVLLQDYMVSVGIPKESCDHLVSRMADIMSIDANPLVKKVNR